MADYIVRHVGTDTSDWQVTAQGFSFTSHENEYVAHIRVGRTLLDFLPRVNVDPVAAAVLVGLPELEGRVRSGGIGDDPETWTLAFADDDYDRLKVAADEKACRWQRRTAPGLVCDATPPGRDARTTVPTCAACVIPDERVICRHLVHPRVEVDDAMGSGLRRDVLTVLCDADEDIGDGSECRPGGKPCWERAVSTATAADVEPPPDVAKRAADEVDYFRLVYRDRYNAAVLTIPQARSVAEFFGQCDSEPDFTRRVTSLADLLAHMKPHGQLPKDQRIDENGNRVGSLVALHRLMERDYPAGVPDVESLRLIPRARQVFPIHSRTGEVVAAMRALGIDYPTTDWHSAWLRVLAVFLAALGGMRTAIQSGEPQSTAAE